LQARRLVAVHPRRRVETRQREGARAEGAARARTADRAGPDAMARPLRRAGLIAPAALVALSTVAYALAGRRVAGLWIMPDEAISADRALRLWHHGSLPVFRGQGAGYGFLYPALAAAPLALGSLASLKLVQAFVMSLAAVPVFLYGRRLMPPVYALVAAALTLATPLLLYSGFVMTEVLFYPLAALTLIAIAYATETGRLR